MVVLTGDIEQVRGQLPRQAAGDRLIVDRQPRSSFPSQHPPDEAGVAIGQGMLIEQSLQFRVVRADEEHSLDLGLFAVVTHQGGGSPAAGQQVDGLEDDRLAGPGLTGKDNEAG